jgi:hypothetical protein
VIGWADRIPLDEAFGRLLRVAAGVADVDAVMWGQGVCIINFKEQ